MRILYIANLIPYPLDGGGKIFTFSTIQALSNSNDIDLLCFYEHEQVDVGENMLASYCNYIKALPIRVTTSENKSLMVKKAFKSLFSRYPLAVEKYASQEMYENIESLLTNNTYDCVFINLLAMCIYFDHIKKIKPEIRVILYEQNCEAIIYKRLFEKEQRIIKKCFIGMEYKKLYRFEQETINKVDKVIVLSKEDRKNLKIEQASVIPIGVQPQKYRKKYDNGIHEKVKMLFVGTMTWAPNSEGIIWFLKNVMPMCGDIEKYDLTIVGKNPSQEVRELANRYSNVHVLGYVESLDAVYDNADVLVVPLLVGSGQRVKIIEAFAKAYPVISTSIGAEGLDYVDNETILIANSAEEFKTQIDKCFDHKLLKKIGLGGLKVFEKEYSTIIIGKKLEKAIR